MAPADAVTARRIAARLRPVLGLALAGAMAPASAIEGFPGDTWGRVSHILDDSSGTGISFFVNQGVDWVELPGELMLNTFVEYRYARRTQDRTYFDSEGEAVGLDLKRSPIHFGVEWYREKNPEQDGLTRDITRGYLSWYDDWYSYKRRRLDPDRWLRYTALTGSTWGRVRGEFSGQEYLTVNFFVNQGIDWFELPGGITFNTFVEPRFSYRSKDADYYNTLGPAIGMELQRSPFKLGMDHLWEYFTERQVWERTWRLYFTWYYNWDLENLGDD